MGEKTHGAEIAFFGGSFTAIDRDYMLSLLEVASKAVKDYGFIGIRCSTRPDKIDEEVLRILKKYGVTSIELGAQSMSDRILFMNDRGHDAQSVRKASSLIKSFSFELGLQMMTGLYGSSEEDDINTAKELIKLSPATVRIYPTITLENTRLADLYRSGEYNPLSLEATVNLVSKLIPMFEENGIRVIRVGLHASEEMDVRVAGPYHPAFKELCISEILFNKISDELLKKREPSDEEIIIKCSPKLLSACIGQKKANVGKFKKLGYNVRFVPDGETDKFSIS